MIRVRWQIASHHLIAQERTENSTQKHKRNNIYKNNSDENVNISEAEME